LTDSSLFQQLRDRPLVAVGKELTEKSTNQVGVVRVQRSAFYELSVNPTINQLSNADSERLVAWIGKVAGIADFIMTESLVA
jgi:hypothetical protein